MVAPAGARARLARRSSDTRGPSRPVSGQRGQHVTPKRYLIVNADDFGLSPGVNAGIVAAHENGIVTSASLMVRKLAAAEAADYGRRHPKFSVGLHVDLG